MLQGLTAEELDMLAGKDGDAEEGQETQLEETRKKRTPLRERRARREAESAALAEEEEKKNSNQFHLI
jgi:hypothetical protein